MPPARRKARTHFNPRSREGSDNRGGDGAPFGDISIHAPVKGATRNLRLLYADDPISIHAPVKGATLPRGHVARIQSISIHAPVKGATKRRSGRQTGFPISIHAPVKGATGCAPLEGCGPGFQSTLP